MKYAARVMVGIGLIGSLTTVSPAAATLKCGGLPNNTALRALLVAAPSGSPNSPGEAGGLFNGTRMWGAIVNRDGELCSFITSTTDPTQVWPGSQAIAKAKAYTANAFSLDILALSTARLYTFVQPGHSLFGLNNSNPFNPGALALPKKPEGDGQIAGGIITFGGGVPLYNADGKIIGGLGISGDTACADHEIAKKVRDLAGLNPPDGALVDDIVFSVDSDGPSAFDHPLCPNTIRNGVLIGNEKPSSGY